MRPVFKVSMHEHTSKDDPGLPACSKEDHNGTPLFLREELTHIGEYNRLRTSYPAGVREGTHGISHTQLHVHTLLNYRSLTATSFQDYSV